MRYRASNPLLEAFEELDKLNEASKIGASRTFWTYAKENKISTYWFHEAFDEELTELKLMDIFNEEGMLKNPGTWRSIKSALETNPDSWAVKALKKLWVLQFKEGATKSIEQKSREAEEERRAKKQAEYEAKKEQDRLAREAEYAAAKEDWDILNKQLPSIQALVNTIAEEFAAEKKAILVSDLEATLKLEAEIKTVTKGLEPLYDTTAGMYLHDLRSKADSIKVSTTLAELDKRFPNPRIFVKVQEFLGETYFRFRNKQVFEYTSFTVDNIEEETVKSELLSLLNNIWEAVNSKRNDLKYRQRQHNEIMTKVNAAKAAQDAVDAGRPVDPSFVSNILAELARGKASAKKAYNFYSDTTDGSAGAAEAMAIHNTLVAIGTYLVNCNWRATVKGTEVAEWRMTDSVDELEDALEAAFDMFSQDLMIEIVK
jgi:hypothetical protein